MKILLTLLASILLLFIGAVIVAIYAIALGIKVAMLTFPCLAVIITALLIVFLVGRLLF